MCKLKSSNEFLKGHNDADSKNLAVRNDQKIMTGNFCPECNNGQVAITVDTEKGFSLSCKTCDYVGPVISDAFKYLNLWLSERYSNGGDRYKMVNTIIFYMKRKPDLQRAMLDTLDCQTLL
jgi:hypothetical protein